MKVLIVGTAGFVGRHLDAYLRAKGDDVTARSSTDGTGIDPRTGLLPERFTVPPGTGAVYYLAQSPYYREGVDQAWHVLNVNVVSAVRVAALAAKAGVRKMIYTSTGNVYAPGFGAYAESSPLRRDALYELSKVQAEEALSLFQGRLNLTVVRLFGIYGPGQSGRLIPNLAAAIASGKPLIIERHPIDPSDLGGLRVSPCYIDDTVGILAGLIRRESPPAMNVAGDEVLSVRQIAAAIGRLLGREPSFEVAVRSRAGDLVADIGLLKRLLDPRFTPFETGLRRTLGVAES